ncbi:hypothetical protein J6590_041749 [Homalodisca vitripennis]|nr:hypothetical protein J6590_041749 [Homalodisca vitripennis]
MGCTPMGAHGMYSYGSTWNVLPWEYMSILPTWPGSAVTQFEPVGDKSFELVAVSELEGVKAIIISAISAQNVYAWGYSCATGGTLLGLGGLHSGIVFGRNQVSFVMN